MNVVEQTAGAAMASTATTFDMTDDITISAYNEDGVPVAAPVINAAASCQYIGR